MECKQGILKELFKDIVQIGIVVSDLEKTKEAMRDVFGLEPDSGGDMHYEKVSYRGSEQDAYVKAAFYDYFNIQLEILEPMGEEDTVWSDASKMGLGSLHHVRFDVENHDLVTRLMAEKGIGIWMEGRSARNPNVKFTYYDSVEKLGFIVEAVTKTV